MGVKWTLAVLQLKFSIISSLNSFNGSQLAEVKKYIPHMSLPLNLWGKSSKPKNFQLYLKSTILWKCEILAILR